MMIKPQIQEGVPEEEGYYLFKNGPVWEPVIVKQGEEGLIAEGRMRLQEVYDEFERLTWSEKIGEPEVEK